MLIYIQIVLSFQDWSEGLFPLMWSLRVECGLGLCMSFTPNQVSTKLSSQQPAQFIAHPTPSYQLLK